MSGFGFKSLPDNVVLGQLSRAVFDALADFTSFPWPIMQAQCKRANVSPATLTVAELVLVTPLLVSAVERFTSPAQGVAVAAALRKLAHAR